MLKTSALIPGQRVRLTQFGQTNHDYRLKLLALGVIIGIEAFVVRTAPMGCPIQFDVQGRSIVLRKDEAAHLCWEPL